MKKLLTYSLLTISLAFSVPAYAQFGLPKLPGSGSSNAAAPDLDTFLTTAVEAQSLVNISSQHVFSAVGTDDELRAIKAERDAAEATPDPKERDAALKRVDADTLTQLSKMDMDSRAAAVQKNLDMKKSAELGAAVYNLALGLLKDKDLAVQGQAVGKSLSNPMTAARYATKIGEFKNISSSIADQASQAPSIIGNLSKLASATKLAVLPTSSTDQPKAVEAD